MCLPTLTKIEHLKTLIIEKPSLTKVNTTNEDFNEAMTFFLTYVVTKCSTLNKLSLRGLTEEVILNVLDRLKQRICKLVIKTNVTISNEVKLQLLK